ncbi:MAG: hypothetical protein ABI646_05910 [Acidobacteriota bacterium]
MNTTFTKIAFLVAIVVMLAASAHAQNGFRANVPFDFNIGAKSYKAGVYLLSKVSSASDSPAMVLRDSQGGNSYAMMPTNSSYSEVEPATLTFRRYNDRYFLADIKALHVNVEFSTSKMEKIVAKEIRAQRQTIAMSRAK